MREASGLNKLSTRDVVHGQGGRIHRDLGQVFAFALHVGSQAELVDARLNGLDELFGQWTLYAGPVSELIYKRLVIVMEQRGGWAHSLLAPPPDFEDVVEIAIQRQIAWRWLIVKDRLIEIPNRGFHL